MGFNYGHKNLPKQTQEILRKQEQSRKLLEEDEKKRVTMVEEKILVLLKKADKSKTHGEITEELGFKGQEVLKALNNLVKQNKVQLSVIESSNVNTPYYFI